MGSFRAVVILVIVFFTILHTTNTQGTDFTNFNGSYNEKTGDSRTYEVYNATSFHLANGTTVNFTTTYNLVETATVLENNFTNSNNTGVYIQFTTNVINFGLLHSSIYRQDFLSSSEIGNLFFSVGTYFSKIYYGFLFPSFNTSRDVISYVNSLPNASLLSFYNYSITNDLIILNSPFRSFIGPNERYTYVISNSSYNWHTGWLQSYNGIIRYNKTVEFFSIKLIPGRSEIIPTFLITFLEDSIVLIVVMAVIVLFFSYFRYRKISKHNQSKQNFSTFLKKEFVHRKTKRTVQPGNINRALEEIEDIIKESG